MSEEEELPKLGKRTMLVWVRTPLGATLVEQTVEEEVNENNKVS